MRCQHHSSDNDGLIQIAAELAARALRSDTSRVLAGLALVLGVPSAVIAFVFAFAAAR